MPPFFHLQNGNTHGCFKNAFQGLEIVAWCPKCLNDKEDVRRAFPKRE